MFWADKLAKDIITSGNYTPYWADDMKTPSGFAHVGSVMGPVIHSMIARALKDAGKEVTYTFVINDFDPADDLLPEMRGKFESELGKPLKLAKSPDPRFESMADLFADDFIQSIRSVGVEAEILSSWKMYHEGKFDGVIREALDNAEKIQDIYQKVSGSEKKAAGWLPFQVICESCGKLGTTRVFAWDGEKVSYTCEENLVKWAQGCGNEGKVSPFGGTGKLPWKVDWAAHWKVIGITIEGAGKDHASKGGSYDIAMTICKEVFDFPQPFKLPYEFILIGGKKMSSSKGIGLKAHDLVKILPPSVARFLFARNGIKSQTNFDPDEPNAIPVLFDDYQKAAAAYFDKSDEELARSFELSQVGELQKPPMDVRFATLVQWVQMPNMQDTIKEKGLGEWAKYAKIWLERFAPEDQKFDVKIQTPENVKNLSAEQKEFLQIVADMLETATDAEEFQKTIYEKAKEIKLSSKDAFGAIYSALLGKNSGPKAGWLILSLEKDFVQQRFRKLEDGQAIQDSYTSLETFNDPSIFSISSEVTEKYPSLSVGIAVIKGVTIKNQNEKLEEEKRELLNHLGNLTNEKINEFVEVQAYRKLYKEMGIDYHSRRPSPEALLRRIAQGKDLYTINTCVDAYNLVVMSKRVSIGAFDLDLIKFPTILRYAKEGETIELLGDSEETLYKSTELAYFDQIGGYNIDFNYRDAKRTCVTEKTTNLLLNVDGINGITPELVAESLKLATEKIILYCGGEVSVSGVVTATR